MPTTNFYSHIKASTKNANKNYIQMDFAKSGDYDMLTSDQLFHNEYLQFLVDSGYGTKGEREYHSGYGAIHKYPYIRIPKDIYPTIPTKEDYKQMKKREYETKAKIEEEQKAAEKLVRQAEINTNVQSIIYTDEPMETIDIDIPINLEFLAERGLKLAQKKINNEKSKKNKGRTFSAISNKSKASIDDAISAIREQFVETEKNKVTPILREEAKKLYKVPSPADRGGSNIHFIMMMENMQKMYIAEKVKEHIDRKLPKITAVLEKIHEGMVFGFAPVKKKVNTNTNLLRFNELKNINFSYRPTEGPAKPYDPFEGLNTSPNLTHNDFTAAGINIEPETIDHLTKNQKQELLSLLVTLSKAEHNDAINSFISKKLSKGGKRKTRKIRKGKKGTHRH